MERWAAEAGLIRHLSHFLLTRAAQLGNDRSMGVYCIFGKRLVLGICLIGGSYSGSAQILLEYTFPSSGSLAPTTVDANASATSINFTGSTASQFALAANVLTINSGVGASSAATAVSANSYIQFTLSPDSGFVLNLTSFSFSGAYGPPAGGGFVVRSSRDGYSADLASGQITTQYPTLSSYQADLTNPSFQDVSEAITFRTYIFSNPGGGNPAIVLDDLRVNGTLTVVPEPAAVSMFAAAGIVGFALFRAVKRRTVLA
jgi:hypothetical protein